MRGLLRLAGWGGLAAAAVLLAVIAANSNGRLLRPGADTQAIRAAELAKAEAAKAAQLARIAATEDETRRLTEMVRALSADRERLITRVSVLERKLDDVTGSIKKQAAAAPAPTPNPETLPKITSAPPPAAPIPAPSGPPIRTGSLPPPSSAPESDSARPAAGVDIGGANNFDGLRTLWNSVTAAHASLFDGLHPVVAVRENNKSRAADLRLVAGPLTDLESATRICTALAAAKQFCRLVTFEGAPLTLAGRRAACATRCCSRSKGSSGGTTATAPPWPLNAIAARRSRGHSPVMQATFFPTARQTNWLLIVGFLAIGQALYLRYLAIEFAPVSLACQGGLQSWLCTTFRAVIVLYNHGAFGWIALIAAMLNLVRPSLVLMSVAIAAAGFGLVLHNTDLAGLAAALLVLSLARPAPAAD